MDPYRIIEPRLLALFRLFVGVNLALAVPVMFFSERMLEISVGQVQFLGLIILILLFIYLSIPRLITVFGRFYLPVAIVTASILPVVITRIHQLKFLEESRMVTKWVEQYLFQTNSGIALNSSNNWVVSLFLPLVLVAWQYNLRSVLVFTFGTALLDFGLSVHLFGTNNEELFSMFNAISNRSVAFILIGFVIVRLVAQQREQQRELTQANKKLSHYANMLEEFAVSLEQLTISRERNRLARELHDTLAHTLSALSVQLEATDTVWEKNPEQARHLLQNALCTTRSGLTETRRALQALRASPLDDLGFGLAVRTMAESAAERSGFSINVDISTQLGDLKPQVEQTLYRVFQESLENVSRHACAREVSLQISRDNHYVKALVVDDGIGFDVKSVDREKRRLGLRGMIERVELLGGTLVVKSESGKGTTIDVLINEGAL